MNPTPNLGLHALIAAWIGLTVYLFLVSEPRSIGWAILGPIAVAVIYFVVQLLRARRARRASPHREADRL